MSICARKTPQTVSRTWICTKSAGNFIENIRFLFCTEKIFLGNKLSYRYRVKTKFTVESEVVDGG